MDEMAFVTALLKEYDGLEAITLHQLSAYTAAEGYLVYRLQHADGRTWTARAYQRDRSLPDWFRLFYPWATPDTAEWVETRAATLFVLEMQEYPAPRVLMTRSGELVSKTPEWCLLI